MELTLEEGETRSVFKLYQFNLDNGQCTEVEHMKRYIEEKQSQIAVQMVFVKRETARQYRTEGKAMNDQQIQKLLLQQIVAINFIEKPKPGESQAVIFQNAVKVSFRCLGDV